MATDRSLPLNKILSSILREFEKASLSVDISREYLREEYRNHPILNDTIPSRIRVAEASISMPLAFESIGKEVTVQQEISKRQILSIVLGEVDVFCDKEQFATTFLLELRKNKKALLANKNLIADIQKVGKSLLAGFNLPEHSKKKLEELQRSFASNPKKNQEARFIFQSEELEKIPHDRIFKMDFKIFSD